MGVFTTLKKSTNEIKDAAHSKYRCQYQIVFVVFASKKDGKKYMEN